MIRLQYICSVLLFVATVSTTLAQRGTNRFNQVYPVGDDSDINYKFRQYHNSETILFEANPVVRFSFFNNIQKNLSSDSTRASAYYISFRPQLRMYTDTSKPVKMPSYRILLATQQVRRINKKNLLTFSFETGHYSNGQDGSSFSELYDDESKESDSIYATINGNTDLSSLLNRRSGNFSTNLTELIVNYRINKLEPKNCSPIETYSFKAGAVIFHDRLLYVFDIGGYSDNDIRIYGHMRYLAGFSYTRVFSKHCRMTFSTDAEYISGAHPHVKPFRLVRKISWFPSIGIPHFAFFFDWSTGHDNYNFRFVDSGNQASLGFLWNPFEAFSLWRMADGDSCPGVR